jgi:hypothetical protein
MGIGMKAAAAAAATIMGASALLAGGSTATAAPAPSVSGNASFTWGQKCASMSQSLRPVLPAKPTRGGAVLPVTAATGKQITLGGAFRWYASGPTTPPMTFTDPQIAIAGTNAGNFVVTLTAGSAVTTKVPLIHIANFKKVSVNAKTRQWTGVLQAPLKGTKAVDAASIASLLSGMCRADIFPGDTLGSITVTAKSS